MRKFTSLENGSRVPPVRPAFVAIELKLLSRSICGWAETAKPAEAKPARKARKRPAVASKTTGRKLILPDDVHDRLWLLARQRKTSVSAVATDILDRNLPRFSVTREG